jgi:hypothetical protein
MAMTELINKVAQSGIITLDLEQFLPERKVEGLDISQFLFRGLLLKEKDFRTAVKEFDWTVFSGKIVAVYCSTDAIVAQWAYMLLASALQDAGADFYIGTPGETEAQLLLNNIRNIAPEKYQDERVVIKGCGTQPLPDAAYLEITKLLKPYVKTLMFGEPCSTVPIYKKR